MSISKWWKKLFQSEQEEFDELFNHTLDQIAIAEEQTEYTYNPDGSMASVKQLVPQWGHGGMYFIPQVIHFAYENFGFRGRNDN